VVSSEVGITGVSGIPGFGEVTIGTGLTTTVGLTATAGLTMTVGGGLIGGGFGTIIWHLSFISKVSSGRKSSMSPCLLDHFEHVECPKLP